MNRQREYSTESYCCCSLRDRCLIFAAQVLGLYTLAEFGCLVALLAINSPELQQVREVYGAVINGYLIGLFVICTVFLIITVCLIVGILKQRRCLLLVFLIAFGIVVVLQFLGSIGAFISMFKSVACGQLMNKWTNLVGICLNKEYALQSAKQLREISTISAMTVIIYGACTVYYIWGWWSVLSLFRKMRNLADHREMKMNLIPSAKPFSDDIEKDAEEMD